MESETYLRVAGGFAVLLVAPLALRTLRNRTGETASGSKIWTLIGVAAAGVAACLFLPPGPLAGALTLPWLALATSLLVREALRAGRRGAWRQFRAGDIAPILALVFFAVGASWLFLARAGLQPLGFSTFIVELTAVHFHIAGLGGMTLASRTQESARGRWCPVSIVAGVLAAAGIMIVAIGITGPNAGFAGLVALQAIGGSTVGIGFITIVVTELFGTGAHGSARVLFGVGAACLSLGMILAVSYSAGVWLATPSLSIDQMIRTHGILNGVGFVFCGLIGWLTRAREAT